MNAHPQGPVLEEQSLYMCLREGRPATRAPLDPADVRALPDRYLRAMIEGYARFAKPLNNAGPHVPGSAITYVAWGTAVDNCAILLRELVRRTPETEYQARARRRTLATVRDNCPSALARDAEL